MDITVFPTKLTGCVRVPTSKSMGHRIMICRYLAGGSISTEGLDVSDDIMATEAALAGLAKGVCDCGESGSTLRFIVPVALVHGGSYVFTGRGRLLKRPMEEYRRVFTDKGIKWNEDSDGLRVSGKLESGEYILDGGISSQYITGLLLSLPLLQGDSRIILTSPLQSRSYVDITLAIQSAFGVQCTPVPDGYYIKGGQQYRPAPVLPEPDFSQAAFWMTANALGCDISMELPEKSVQGDSVIRSILRSGSRDIDISDCPDLAPTLAVWLSVVGGRLTNCLRLRYKESDRINSVRAMLGALGCATELEGDCLKIHKSRLHGGTVDTFGDHRIAMAAAVAAVAADGEVTVKGAECVRKSYPAFWDDYKKLGGKIHERNMG